MTPPPRSSVAPLVPLSRLAVGEVAVIARVDAGATEVERLAALGLVPGVSVRLLRRGTSLAVAVGEARIALGSTWAAALSVVRSA